MINTPLRSFCIIFIWLQQVFSTYFIHWMVAYPVDNAIHPLNNWDLIKATRSDSSVSENKPHLLLLAVILVGQACLQYCNLHVLHCVVGLVEVSGDWKVISPVDYISTVFSELVRQPASSLSDVNCRWTFDTCQTINHIVHDAGKVSCDVNMPFGCYNRANF